MGNEIIKKTQNIISNFEKTFQPGETIKKVSRRTKVVTNHSEYTIWEVATNGGKNIATFQNVKLLK